MSDNTMYIFGKIFAVVEQHGEIPASIFNKAPHRPFVGLALIKNRMEWRKAQKNDAEELAMLFNKIPADWKDPPRGVDVEGQGSFWMGYYHRSYINDIHKNFSPNILEESGKLIFGEHWQKPMAEALGLSDTARIRQWLTGGNKVPVGVWSEIDTLLRQKEARISALLEAKASTASV